MQQAGYELRFDWGPAGAAAVGRSAGTLVIVDVLSFTTSVSVAIDRGTAVYPAAWRDGRAQVLAGEVGAAVAVGRRQVSPDNPWSLSPAALRAAPAVPRLVLPSPNGSAIAASASGLVIAACLRNAAAVSTWLHANDHTAVTVIAAGERWPDGSLRPALEDLLGAGAVLSRMCALGDYRLSPEASATLRAFESTPSLDAAVRASASGLELSESGFSDDIDIALEIDSSAVVPVIADGAFRDFSGA